ncbi:MAG: glutamate-5-semialdehyde dehydrogenase [Minisyncoccales bacterium]
MKESLKKAKEKQILLSSISIQKRNQALKNISATLNDSREKIKKANSIDISKNSKIKSSLLKRLKVDDKKIDEMISGLDSLIKLEDPLNKILLKTKLDDGLILTKLSVPIGVLGVIFESRPDALVQIVGLCIKSGNAVALKGGKEAFNTNKVLYEIIIDSVKDFIPKETIVLLETREDVKKMLDMDKYLDLIIPRGSNALVQYIMNNTNIPVMGHADGICHVYVDKMADIDTAVSVCFDSKCQYPAVCNAMETMLVHKDVAKEFLPKIKEKYDNAGVELRGCEKTKQIIECKDVSKDDWKTEYNSLVLSIKIVDSLDEAIEFINKYGSGHTDSIVSKDDEAIIKFRNMVDSSSVISNASTRFADGFRYGFGAEVGISTGKIHARGPVGLDGLTIYKFIVEGNGHIVSDYAEGKKAFKHEKM